MTERRFRDRFKRSPVKQLEQDGPPLRIPLELILRICQTASTSCYSEAARDQLHSNLACVNRTFSSLFGRRKWRTVGMRDGATLPELIERLKVDKEGSDWIEGVEIEDLVEHYSRRRLEQNWAKLQKRCKNLRFVQLGIPEIQPKMYNGVYGWVLNGMTDITTLRLVSLELNHARTQGSLFGKKPHHVPCIPPNLRHLVLDRVQLHGVMNDDDYAALWPPLAQCQLVSLYLAQLKLSGFSPQANTLVPQMRELVKRNSRTLRALHYSRPQGFTLGPDEPLFNSKLHLPELRILSLSLLHFNAAVLDAVPKLQHLSLTLCDLPGAYNLDERHKAVRLAMPLLAEALASGSALTQLRTLELPVHSELVDCGAEIWGLQELAESAGVRVKMVDAATLDVETHFRLLVRDELMERM
ncbi:hypothetical protein JCM6882_008110 [Rhodosporidiobolus microsporus]